MRKYLMSMLAVMLTACSLTLVSCSSSDDEPQIDDKIKFAAVETVFAVTPDLAEMCDIKATYYDVTGEKKTVSMNTNKVKKSFTTGTLAQNIDEWCIVTFTEQLNYLPSTMEFTVEFSLNGKKPSTDKPNMVVIRDIYGACFNATANKIKDGSIAFTEEGALGVSEEDWASMVKRFNSRLGDIAIAVDKDGNFNYRD